MHSMDNAHSKTGYALPEEMIVLLQQSVKFMVCAMLPKGFVKLHLSKAVSCLRAVYYREDANIIAAYVK